MLLASEPGAIPAEQMMLRLALRRKVALPILVRCHLLPPAVQLTRLSKTSRRGFAAESLLEPGIIIAIFSGNAALTRMQIRASVCFFRLTL